MGRPELTGIGGHVPAISPDDIRQIGIRSVDEGEKRFLREQGVEVFDMRYIDEVGMRHTLELALAGLDDNTHLHVSFDVDFLDPEIAPGVGTTVRGGPTYREAQLCMEMIADTGRLGSLDIVELNPALDNRNMTAELGGRSGREPVRQEHAVASVSILKFRGSAPENGASPSAVKVPTMNALNQPHLRFRRTSCRDGRLLPRRRAGVCGRTGCRIPCPAAR